LKETMMNTTATLERQTIGETPRGDLSSAGKNPWTSDHVLLSLSVWWVRQTRPDSPDFGSDVASVFDGLQRDLQ
jgi:hypothetical protein